MHRDSQKRIYGNYVYFITCFVQDKNEFFKEEILSEVWIEELKLAKKMKKFELYAFCLNYDHFHLLIKPNKKNYSQIMHFLKRHTSRNINIILGYNKFDLRKIMYPDDEGEVVNNIQKNTENIFSITNSNGKNHFTTILFATKMTLKIIGTIRCSII